MRLHPIRHKYIILLQAKGLANGNPIGFGAMCDQEAFHILMMIPPCPVQRCDPGVCSGIDCCPVANQYLGDLGVAAIGGLVQRRVAVADPGIDVGAMTKNLYT